jgi:hypothetical protein
LLGCPDRNGSPRYHDDINFETDQLGRKLRMSIELPTETVSRRTGSSEQKIMLTNTEFSLVV